MFKLYRIFLCLTIFLVYGCMNQGKLGFYENQNNDSNFHFIDSLTLKLDNFSTYDILFNQVSKFRGIEALYVYNVANHSLDIYDLNAGKLIHRLKFLKEGPNEIKGVLNFYVHNEDSIFIYPKMTFNNTVLIDINGNVKNRFRPFLPLTNQISRVLNHNSTSSSPTYYLNSKLLFDQLSLRSSLEPESTEFKTSGYVDLIKDSIFLYENAVYPEIYLKKPMSMIFKISSRLLNKNREWVYSWEALDSLMIFDLEMNFLRKEFAKSNFKISELPEPINFDTHREIRQGIEETYYSRIVTDTENNYYYRIVSIGGVYNPETDKSFFAVSKNDFSVIVLDKDFKILDERLFPGGTYSIYQAFATEKGLHLPKNNPNYKKLDEEKLVIDIFRMNYE